VNKKSPAQKQKKIQCRLGGTFFMTLPVGVAIFVSCQKAEIVNDEDSLLVLKDDPIHYRRRN
jgi:hypothetical protein